jgi:hypothetical protein
VTISEEELMKRLDFLLNSSEAGNPVDHMLVVAGAPGPSGMVAEDAVETTVYALAYEGGDDTPDQFVSKAIVAAGVYHFRKGKKILFAGLARDFVAVQDGDDLSRRLNAEGRLDEHPRAGEVTFVYAACSDGRRWRSRRWLTGPKAGQVEDVTLLVGPPDEQEQHQQPTMLRRLVAFP